MIAAIFAVVAAEAVFLTWTVRERGLFEYIGLDYRGSRTAGEAILEHGFNAAYDPALVEDSQREIFDAYTEDSNPHRLPFYVVPAPYPPPFTLAFVPSNWFTPVPGLAAWTLFHLIVLAFYPLRLAKAFELSRPGWLIAAVVLSFPALFNFIMGQFSVWLVVFFGEALIAFDRRRDLVAGIWLGLLVCKPQTLVLLVPALLIGGRFTILAGMAISITALLVPTLLIDGAWLSKYLGGLVDAAGSTGQVMNIFPSTMTNWRAFALNAARFHPPWLAWAVAIPAMIGTGIVGLLCAVGLRTPIRLGNGFAWLGLAAATCAFSWHAHAHQTLMLVPPLFIVLASRPQLVGRATSLFLGTSALFVAAAFALGIDLAHEVLGQLLLALMIVVTAWCALELRSRDSG
jgi:hypothetical protein